MEIDKTKEELNIELNKFELDLSAKQKDIETSKPLDNRLTTWVTRLSGGLINEQMAERILLGFAVVVIIFSFFMFFSRIHKKSFPTNEIINKLNDPRAEYLRKKK